MKLAYLAACVLAMAPGLHGCDKKPVAADVQATTDNTWPQALLTKYDCLKCHTPENRLVGPALRDVASRYRDDEQARTHLVGVIKRGGKGVWGNVPMPPHPQIADDDAHKLVDWILNLK